MPLSRHSTTHKAHDAYDAPDHDPGLRAAARERGADRAFLLLRAMFTIAPIAFGLDKFAEVLTDNWEGYLAGWVDDLVPGTAHEAMLAVGVVEILAGVVVALAPRFGGLLVAAWLGGIIINLLTLDDFYDVALRDFGLLVAAVALSMLAAGRSARTTS